MMFDLDVLLKFKPVRWIVPVTTALSQMITYTI